MGAVIVVDAMNVMGSVPDGWWRDRAGALGRLVDAVAAHPWPDDEWVVVVADGRAPGVDDARPRPGTRGGVELRYAGSSAPDAADDAIVALLAADDDPGRVVVVTSDRGLVSRVAELGASVEGARTFRRRLGY